MRIFLAGRISDDLWTRKSTVWESERETLIGALARYDQQASTDYAARLLLGRFGLSTSTFRSFPLESAPFVCKVSRIFQLLGIYMKDLKWNPGPGVRT